MKIAIWGNSGSGKSTVAIKLAMSFARASKNVLLIDANFVTPQFNVWYPSRPLDVSDSISELLRNDITIDDMMRKTQIINDRLGVLGYALEPMVKAMPLRQDTVAELYKRVEDGTADIVITDCQTNFSNDFLSYQAIATADVVFVVMTADPKAISWYKANVVPLKDRLKSNRCRVINVFGQARTADPVYDVEAYLGNAQYVLPYHTKIAEENQNGTIGDENYRRTARKYANIIDTMAKDVLASQKGIARDHAFDDIAKENRAAEERRGDR